MSTHARVVDTGPSAGQIVGFRWSRVADSPVGARSQPLVVWDGRELLEFGGPGGEGAAFDPGTGQWRRISAAGGDTGVGNAVSVWTGRLLFVADGVPGACSGRAGRDHLAAGCLARAGLYDPADDRWTSTVLPEQLDGTTLDAAVWTGKEVVLAGVSSRGGRLAVGAYDPADGRWRMITPGLPARHPAQGAVLAVARGRLFLWSLWNRVYASTGYFGVDVLAWGSGGWRDVTGKWPQNQDVTSPVGADGSILVSPGQIWCGLSCSPPYGALPGYFADPVTLARTVVPAGPLGLADPAFVWTGRAIIAVNMDARISNPGGRGGIQPDDMALWEPGARRWLGLPAVPGHPGLAVTPIWTGTELFALTDSGQLFVFHR